MRLRYDPTTVVIDLTAKCNQACGFCWRADRDAVRRETRDLPALTMPRALFDRIVAAISPIETVDRVSLCGPMGEPTLVEDLDGRGAALMALGFSEVAINTNGVALDRFDPGALLDGFTEIVVSLDAADAETHAAIHGKRGQFDRIVENVVRLARVRNERAAGAVLEVRFTEGDRNCGQVGRVRRAFEPLGVEVRHRRVHSFVDTLAEHGDRAGAILCNQPRHNVNFTMTGHVTTCCVNYRRVPVFGHVDDGRTIKEIWESPAFEAWRRERHAGICAGCSGLGTGLQKPAGKLSDHERRRLEAITRRGEADYFAGAV